MANDLVHGRERAGRVTASVASVIMSGGEAAWDTLLARMWADDGSDFASPSTGARAHGHEYEAVGRALFWERHHSMTINESDFVKFRRSGFPLNHQYRRMLGCSPDGIAVLGTGPNRKTYGVEIKSPVDVGVYTVYAAFCARHQLPPEHTDQVFFSLWVTGWHGWYFVTHHTGQYAEHFVSAGDPAFKAWTKRFRPRVAAFLKLYETGQKPERDKLDASGLAALIRATQ